VARLACSTLSADSSNIPSAPGSLYAPPPPIRHLAPCPGCPRAKPASTAFALYSISISMYLLLFRLDRLLQKPL
jgi:hypothetical protein